MTGPSKKVGFDRSAALRLGLAGALVIALVLATGVPAPAQSGPFAQIVAFSFVPGANNITLGIAINKGIENAARAGANFGLVLTVTYVAVNGAIQTLNSGRLSIKDNTVLVNPIDARTVLIQAGLQFGALPLPGNTPGFTGTAQVLHPDPATGVDVAL